MMANYKRGRGDQMGTAGFRMINRDRPAPVANPTGPTTLAWYCMAGNVNEWVMDVYRPLSPEDKVRLQPISW